jgi:hypothetical protein
LGQGQLRGSKFKSECFGIEFPLFLNRLGHLGNHFYKPLGFSRRNPGQMQPLFADTGQIQQFLS